MEKVYIIFTGALDNSKIGLYVIAIIVYKQLECVVQRGNGSVTWSH